MLLYKNLSDKRKSIYSCDRCKKEVTSEKKVSIYTNYIGSTPKKKWDLCITCYRALVRGIEKRRETNEN